MDEPELDRWLSEARSADGKKMSSERLWTVFNMVKSPGNWKNPLQATVPKEMATKDEIVSAVVWYAGGAPTVEDRGDRWQVTGAGYYSWVGA